MDRRWPTAPRVSSGFPPGFLQRLLPAVGPPRRGSVAALHAASQLLILSFYVPVTMSGGVSEALGAWTTSCKRPFEASSATETAPTKTPRLMPASARSHSVQDVGEDCNHHAAQVWQPWQTPLHQNFADSTFPTRPDFAHAAVIDWLQTIGQEHPIRTSTEPSRVGGERSTYSYAGSTTQSDSTEATPASKRSSGRNLVEDPLYRDTHLAANNVYLQHPCDLLPEGIANLVDGIRRNRDSPEPSLREIRQDRHLHDLSMGAAEAEVEQYFHAHIFPSTESSDILKRSDRQPMAKYAVPNFRSKYRISTPAPDMLYGYNRRVAFPQQQAQLLSMGSKLVANNQGLVCPFFAIEFQGDGPSGAGGLWVATNQCLGASSACVNIAEMLNQQLRRQCGNGSIEPIDSTAFSVAMTGTEARLYISWEQNELDYFTTMIDSFQLPKPRDYLEFRKYVRNIIDWGKDRRLKIQESLDRLLEESMKKASEVAKSRPGPSAGSASTSI